MRMNAIFLECGVACKGGKDSIASVWEGIGSLRIDKVLRAVCAQTVVEHIGEHRGRNAPTEAFG